MELETLQRRKNRTMKSKRLGRGYGSGVGGHTVGRGMKGQKSRSGHKSLQFFEGGNVPFFRRMPKYRGFNAKFKVVNSVVSIDSLSKAYEEGETVNLSTLKEKKLVKQSANSVKILGQGKLDKKLTIENLQVSSSAKEKIEKAGGEVK